jgi:prolyl-tRNA synthetase
LIVGPKGVADGVVEIKRRASGERQTLPLEAALKAITT